MNFSPPTKPEQGPTSGARPTEIVSFRAAVLDRPTERFNAGRTIFPKGDPGLSLFQLAEGVVRRCRVMRDGRRMIAGFVLQNEVLDLSAKGSSLFTSEAVIDCRLRRLPPSRLGLLATDAANSPARAADELRHRHCRMNFRLLSMLHKSADERVADLLLDIGRRLCAELRNGSQFTLSIPRGDIADHLGLSVETVCRAISRLRRDGVLTLNGPCRVIVRDVAALRLRAAEEEDDDDPGDDILSMVASIRHRDTVRGMHP